MNFVEYTSILFDIMAQLTTLYRNLIMQSGRVQLAVLKEYLDLILIIFLLIFITETKSFND